MLTPYEIELQRIVEETGMGRMQAINHLRQRNKLRTMPRRASEAMRKNDMLIGMVCENMLAGRDAFFGTGQHLQAEWETDRG